MKNVFLPLLLVGFVCAEIIVNLPDPVDNKYLHMNSTLLWFNETLLNLTTDNRNPIISYPVGVSPWIKNSSGGYEFNESLMNITTDARNSVITLQPNIDSANITAGVLSNVRYNLSYVLVKNNTLVDGRFCEYVNESNSIKCEESLNEAKQQNISGANITSGVIANQHYNISYILNKTYADTLYYSSGNISVANLSVNNRAYFKVFGNDTDYLRVGSYVNGVYGNTPIIEYVSTKNSWGFQSSVYAGNAVQFNSFVDGTGIALVNGTQWMQMSLKNGVGVIRSDSGNIDIMAQDSDDYFRHNTTGNVPYITVVGGNQLVLSADTSGTTLNFDDSVRTVASAYPVTAGYLAAVGGGAIYLRNNRALTVDGTGTNMVLYAANVSGLSMGVIGGAGNMGDIAFSPSSGYVIPYSNMTRSLGKPGILWSTIYVKSTVTSDMWYQGGNEYLIRDIEKPDGIYKQYIPKVLVNSCRTTYKDCLVDDFFYREEVVNSTYNTTVLDVRKIDGKCLDEEQTDCWIRIAEANWNNTKKVLMTYDGDIKTDGVSLKETFAKYEELKVNMTDLAAKVKVLEAKIPK